MLKNGIALDIVTLLALGIQAAFSQNTTRASFPNCFSFGTTSSSFQFEGAVKEDGRGPTIWDTLAHSSGKILDGSNVDVAVDQYHRYHEDIKLMKDMRMDSYRFSITWSRIFPNGIEPFVTLYHWDLPQALEDKYNGWLDLQIITDFAMYAETCFKLFGDRLKQWTSFNEPDTFMVQGYDVGLQAPGRCSILLHLVCKVTAPALAESGSKLPDQPMRPDDSQKCVNSLQSELLNKCVMIPQPNASCD